MKYRHRNQFKLYHRGKPNKPITNSDIEESQPSFTVGDKHLNTGILIIHGYTSTPSSMDFIRDQCIQAGYTVSVPQVAGHNTTIDDFAKTPWQSWCKSIEDAYQTLASKCDHIVVIGQSLGGCLALHLCANHSSIAHAFLLAPAVYPPRVLSYSFLVKPLLDMLRIKELHSIGGGFKDKDAYEMVYKKTPTSTYAQLLQCMLDCQKKLTRISVPITSFFSTDDPVLPKKNAEHLINQLPNSNTELIWVHNSKHVLSKDNDRHKIAKTILETLSNNEIIHGS